MCVCSAQKLLDDPEIFLHSGFMFRKEINTDSLEFDPVWQSCITAPSTGETRARLLIVFNALNLTFFLENRVYFVPPTCFSLFLIYIFLQFSPQVGREGRGEAVCGGSRSSSSIRRCWSFLIVDEKCSAGAVAAAFLQRHSPKQAVCVTRDDS